MKDIYIVPKNTIDAQKLHDKLINWMNLKFIENEEVKSYSPLLKQMIASMCQIDPMNR